MSPFADWSQLLDWLEKRGMFHMELGLNRVNEGLARLGLQKPPFLVCQVLGTNGKGSTCAFLNALCLESRLRTGLYTSPHFISPAERCLVNGEQASQREWLAAASEIARRLPHWQDLTYFEFITLLALLIFRARGCQIVILEAGLGGKNDATTAVAAQALCFAPIALDHARIIGPTLADIARDKTAAIRTGSHVFSAPQFPVAREILLETALTRQARLELCPPWPLPSGSRLSGAFQAENAGVAVAAARLVSGMAGARPLADSEINAALAGAFIPGRRQAIPACASHPALLLDGGHNPHAVARNSREPGEEPGTIIFSCLADKDWRPGLGIIARRHPEARFLVPQLANSRAADASEIAAWLNKLESGRAEAITCENAVALALEKAKLSQPEKLVFLVGSFFLLAEFYALHPEYLRPVFHLHAPENKPAKP